MRMQFVSFHRLLVAAILVFFFSQSARAQGTPSSDIVLAGPNAKLIEVREERTAEPMAQAINGQEIRLLVSRYRLVNPTNRPLSTYVKTYRFGSEPAACRNQVLRVIAIDAAGRHIDGVQRECRYLPNAWRIELAPQSSFVIGIDVVVPINFRQFNIASAPRPDTCYG